MAKNSFFYVGTYVHIFVYCLPTFYKLHEQMKLYMKFGFFCLFLGSKQIFYFQKLYVKPVLFPIAKKSA